MEKAGLRVEIRDGRKKGSTEIMVAADLDGELRELLFPRLHLAVDRSELAREIAGKNPHAIRGMKELFNAAGTRPLAESFLEETRLMTELIGSPNQIEAVSAYLEKRPPVFTDPV